MMMMLLLLSHSPVLNPKLAVVSKKPSGSPSSVARASLGKEAPKEAPRRIGAAGGAGGSAKSTPTKPSPQKNVLELQRSMRRNGSPEEGGWPVPAVIALYISPVGPVPP